MIENDINFRLVICQSFKSIILTYHYNVLIIIVIFLSFTCGFLSKCDRNHICLDNSVRKVILIKIIINNH